MVSDACVYDVAITGNADVSTTHITISDSVILKQQIRDRKVVAPYRFTELSAMDDENNLFLSERSTGA